MFSFLLNRFMHDESGANAVEYGLLAGMISLAIVASVILLGDQVKIMYETIVTRFPTN